MLTGAGAACNCAGPWRLLDVSRCAQAPLDTRSPASPRSEEVKALGGFCRARVFVDRRSYIAGRISRAHSGGRCRPSLLLHGSGPVFGARGAHASSLSQHTLHPGTRPRARHADTVTPQADRCHSDDARTVSRHDVSRESRAALGPVSSLSVHGCGGTTLFHPLPGLRR